MRACHNCLHWSVCNMREDDNPCGYYKPQEKVAVKPQTNADRIRAMSDEDMAAEMYCPYMKDIYDECKFGWHTPTQSCFECKLEWLRQPVKGGEGK